MKLLEPTRESVNLLTVADTEEKKEEHILWIELSEGLWGRRLIQDQLDIVERLRAYTLSDREPDRALYQSRLESTRWKAEELEEPLSKLSAHRRWRLELLKASDDDAQMLVCLIQGLLLTKTGQ